MEESLGYNAIAAGFQGQRHWTDQYPNGDTAEALLNSSFDWNGVREPFVVGAGELMAHQHGHAVEAVVFGSDDKRFAHPVPVKRAVEQRFGGIAIGVLIGPVAPPRCLPTYAPTGRRLPLNGSPGSRSPGGRSTASFT